MWSYLSCVVQGRASDAYAHVGGTEVGVSACCTPLLSPRTIIRVERFRVEALGGLIYLGSFGGLFEDSCRTGRGFFCFALIRTTLRRSFQRAEDFAHSHGFRFIPRTRIRMSLRSGVLVFVLLIIHF
jgi:hypothetical protein